MSSETALLAVPLSAFGLVFVTTYRTLATCSSFRASEAQDAGLVGFMSEVVDILAVFPKGHALVVVSSTITGTDTMRIADKESTYLLLATEVDHLSGRFVAQ